MAYTTIDDPSAYFQTTTYTGNGSADKSVTNAGNSDLQPDWVWIKNRDATDVSCLFDSVRGVTKLLTTVGDVLETTDGDTLDAFQSDGFRVDADVKVNTNNEKYVAWQWKAGTAVSGNTTGSGTAKTYSGSVNTDSGFSIIKYVANGTAGHTIPHHLGVVPQMVIAKSISENRGWPIFHNQLDDNGYSVFLSANSAQADGTDSWNSTTPSSTVVTLNNNENNNKDDDSYIMYSFAEKKGYSKIGYYEGNANVDGPYIHLGFSPAYLMVKPIDAADNWVVFDNKRDSFGNGLLSPFSNHPNKNFAETTDTLQCSFLSNGVKVKNSGNTINRNSSFIYMAFAHQPFVSSKGTPATAV